MGVWKYAKLKFIRSPVSLPDLQSTAYQDRHLCRCLAICVHRLPGVELASPMSV